LEIANFSSCRNSTHVSCGEVNIHGNVVIRTNDAVKTESNSKRMLLVQSVTTKEKMTVASLCSTLNIGEKEDHWR
jgi:hypothetical protein